MRTTIVIDDRLMKRAMRAAGIATKRETVERALLDGETDGLLKVLVAEGTDRIVGATVGKGSLKGEESGRSR